MNLLIQLFFLLKIQKIHDTDNSDSFLKKRNICSFQHRLILNGKWISFYIINKRQFLYVIICIYLTEILEKYFPVYYTLFFKSIAHA